MESSLPRTTQELLGWALTPQPGSRARSHPCRMPPLSTEKNE